MKKVLRIEQMCDTIFVYCGKYESATDDFEGGPQCLYYKFAEARRNISACRSFGTERYAENIDS